MKYPNWNIYTDEQKNYALQHELSLATHNGTTKDDLLNILRWVAEENERLKAQLARKNSAIQEIVEYARTHGAPIAELAELRRTQPENEPLTCEGCEHQGEYENEREYGYPSPCTKCKRVAPDNYRHKPERSGG